MVRQKNDPCIDTGRFFAFIRLSVIRQRFRRRLRPLNIKLHKGKIQKSLKRENDRWICGTTLFAEVRLSKIAASEAYLIQ